MSIWLGEYKGSWYLPHHPIHKQMRREKVKNHQFKGRCHWNINMPLNNNLTIKLTNRMTNENKSTMEKTSIKTPKVILRLRNRTIKAMFHNP